MTAGLTFQTERIERDDFYTEVWIYLEDGPILPLLRWSAHRITIARHDIGDGGPVPPEPHISLVGFGGGLNDLPRYIASLKEVERQARALREEKHALFLVSCPADR
jgi:hypothetical protein